MPAVGTYAKTVVGLAGGLIVLAAGLAVQPSSVDSLRAGIGVGHSGSGSPHQVLSRQYVLLSPSLPSSQLIIGDELTADPRCGSCIESACRAQADACGGHCAAYEACVSGCDENLLCEIDCRAMYPAGEVDQTVLMSCAADACWEACASPFPTFTRDPS